MIQIDIDMPKTCDDCPFHIYHSGRNYVCVATPLFYPMNLANYKGGRKDFCPLKEVPQEPKTGHWINTGAYYTGAYDSIDYVECSCCHYESLEEGDFCPNCGAKMESEET